MECGLGWGTVWGEVSGGVWDNVWVGARGEVWGGVWREVRGDVWGEVRGETKGGEVGGGMGEERGEAWEAWREVGGEVWVGCTVRHGLNYVVRGRSGEVRGEKGAGRITFQMKTLSCSDQILRRRATVHTALAPGRPDYVAG